MRCMSVAQPLILSLSDPCPAALVGEKAARLAQLWQNGLPVPPAVVLTTEALRLYQEANGLSAAAPAAHAAALRQGRFPARLRKQLQQALVALGTATVAVRSSALGEDAQDFSAAGQLLSFLEVPLAEVEEKIKACWAALGSARVAAYWQARGLPPPQAMGVIIQEQIPADYAGVIFSLDPITLTPDRLVVEWVPGLGEALVSGRVDPQRLLLPRRLTAALPELPPALAGCLPELVDYLQQVERLLGGLVDIEWAYSAGRLYLLQARPLTGLGREELFIWSNVNIGENYPQPLSPFTWSIVEPFRYGYFKSLFQVLGLPPAVLEAAAPVIRHLIGIHQGRVYYNLSRWYDMLALFPFSRWFRRFLNHYIGQYLPWPYEPRPRYRWPRNLWDHFRFWSRLGWLWFRLENEIKAFEADFYRHRQTWRSQDLNQGSLVSLVELLNEIQDFLRRRWGRGALADLAAMVFPGLLELWGRKWLGAAADRLLSLCLRELPVKSTGGVKLLQQLAQKLKADPKLWELLQNRRYDELAAGLPAELQGLVRSFLEQFGSRCYFELLLTSPTFEERQDLMWDLVRHYAAEAPVATPPPEVALAPVLAAIQARLAPWQWLLFQRLLAAARQALQLREAVRLCQSLIYGEIRRVALALGRRLTALSYLPAPEDIWLLTQEEVQQLVQGQLLYPELLPELLRLRREAGQRVRVEEPPEFFLRPPGRYWQEAVQGAELPEGVKVLRGLGVAGGRSRGPARVVLDPTQETDFHPGDILVSRSTDPGWTPLFRLAGGLILEKGGLLSHGAIVAREFGLPAVVGIPGVTRLLQSGQVVEVDGDRGEVILLARPETGL